MLEAYLVRFGYLAVSLGAIVEGETVLLAAGAMAQRGLLSLPGIMVAAFMGAVAGDHFWFMAGQRYGAPFIAARPRLAASTGRIQRALHRYGSPFVLGFRFMYGLRIATPIVLGSSGYPYARFALLNLIGSALWAVGFTSLGFAVGASLSKLLEEPIPTEAYWIGAAVLALLIGVALRVNKNRQLRLARERARKALDPSSP